jgi:AraC-like DNA-binding protein
MKVIYEKKTNDFYYRNNNKGCSPLQCRAHLHYSVEIVYMRQGQARAFIDSDTYELETGNLLFIFPNRIHRFEDEGKQNEYDLFIINPDLIPELSQKITTENPQNPVIKSAFQNPRILALLDILSHADQLPPTYKEILMKGYLLSFFAEILDMMPLKNIKPDENQAMRSVVQYCSQNFTRDLSLAILEEELHLSKYYISHLFGDKLGIRFNDYVNSLRISESCRLLRTTDMSITEVSNASGFGTLRTFNRAFIKQMGISPSDYRKSNRSDSFNASIPTEIGATGRADSSFGELPLPIPTAPAPCETTYSDMIFSTGDGCDDVFS